MSPWLIYLWQIADQVITVAGLMGGICLFAGVILIGVWKLEEIEEAKTLGRALLSIGVMAILIAMLTPSSRAIAYMIVIPAIVDSNVIQEDLPELYEFAIEALKDQLKGGSHD